jgi:regulatory protein
MARSSGARVTALRERPRNRVAVELDGRELDRPTVRLLARELRRVEALAVAARALRTRDRTTGELAERLAGRGIRDEARAEALETLERAGLVDDGRFARDRAAALARRGWGDLAIRDDLERRGLAGEAVAGALGALEPERERVEGLLARQGRDARTVRRLAARGFDPDLLDGLVAPDP